MTADRVVEDWPTLEEVKRQLRIQGSDKLDDDLAEECRQAARDTISDRVDWDLVPEGEIPSRLRRAAVMLAARLFKRRDSLDGTLGMPDVGVIRMNYGRDWDIEQLIARYLAYPVA